MVFNTKEWIDDEKNLPYFSENSEKEELGKQLDKEVEWLENEGYDQTIDVYKQWKADLDKIIKPIKKRKQGRNAINKELKNLEWKLNEIENKFDEYIAKRDWIPEEDKLKVSSYIEDTQSWLNTKRDIFDKTPINQNLDIQKEDILSKIANLDEKLK